MKGTYTYENNTQSWECNVDDFAVWTLEIRGEQPLTFRSNPDLGEAHISKQGTLNPLNLYSSRIWMKQLRPERPSQDREAGDNTVGRVWEIQADRGLEPISIQMSFLESDVVFPEIRIWPEKVELQEDLSLKLSCGTRLSLPAEATISWIRGKEDLGSITFGSQVVIHQGIMGKIEWSDQTLKFKSKALTLADQGNYECCISIQNKTACKSAKVTVTPHPRNISCSGQSFIPSSPFQINHFHSKPLLKDGQFITILWHFNRSEWKISTRYPQCRPHLVNMEKGMDYWFGNREHNIPRARRDVIGKILGGFGTVGSVMNSMSIGSLQKDLESTGLLDSKGIHVQRNLNQILNSMVVKTASVLGPSVLHLQETTVGLLKSSNIAEVARACMEIQIEYSTDLKVTAQALHGGITPLGIRNSLPEEYRIALNHLDLWINKWMGCNEKECLGTSLIPLAGQELPVYSMAILGIPVSNNQLLFYKLQYKDFIIPSVAAEPEQVDLSACLHFSSKVLCTPYQIRTVYHSCFHNQSMCPVQVETIKSTYDLVTPINNDKICFQVMTNDEEVKVFFHSCTATSKLKRGLYCAQDGPIEVVLRNVRIPVPKYLSRDVNSIPIQFNLSQVSEFPWKEWAARLEQDQGLLHSLHKQLHEAEVIFQHEQGNLELIEHDLSGMSGMTWWKKFSKSVQSWSHTSAGTAATNFMLHPFIILLCVCLICIFMQVCLICKTKSMYRNLRRSLEQGELILREMIIRKN
ncbi:uncharacterized protein LOC108648307 [Xenopus tropicalis]|uniref:Uncharacterized protein LOC108648307 n=1 Tax=Xenopus tropicalis TaxID=8364 RepID=A0A8J0T5I1_XENTR|nr:uncharacterized protein LOC108648307 [Xenopus tropicalis]